MSNPQTEEQPVYVSVKCPFCKAKVGEGCKGSKGEQIYGFRVPDDPDQPLERCPTAHCSRIAAHAGQPFEKWKQSQKGSS